MTKYTNKGMPHSDMHSMATLFNSHPYINSNSMPVGTKFTATIDSLDFYAATYMYVGMHGC